MRRQKLTIALHPEVFAALSLYADHEAASPSQVCEAALVRFLRGRTGAPAMRLTLGVTIDVDELELTPGVALAMRGELEPPRAAGAPRRASTRR